MDDTDPALRFSAYVVAINSEKRLLAAGCANDQRVRVIELNPPFPMVVELNAHKHPFEPKGGVWRVDQISFEATGRYLIVQYSFGGRGATQSTRLREIYDTKSWTKVWETDNPRIHAVTLSQDGTTLAIVEGHVLKIMPFTVSGR